MKWCSLEECDEGWIKVQRSDGPVSKPCPACREAWEKAGKPGAIVCAPASDESALLTRYRDALEKIIVIADGSGFGLFANIARAALGKE